MCWAVLKAQHTLTITWVYKYMNSLWRIHVDIWQKPTVSCKAISLQLKNKLIKKYINSLILLKPQFYHCLAV